MNLVLGVVKIGTDTACVSDGCSGILIFVTILAMAVAAVIAMIVVFKK